MIPPPKATSTFTFDADTPNIGPRSYGAGGGSPPPASCPGGLAPRSDLRFEVEIQRGLGGSPEVREAGLLEDVPEPGLTGLGAETESDLLRKRVGGADR